MLRNCLIAMAAFGLVVASSLPLPAAGDAAAGKAVYAKKCQTCHGAAGEGNAGMAKVLKVEIAHLGSVAVQKKTDDELKMIIVKGVGKMKPVMGLSDGDIDNIIALIRTLKM